MKIISTTYLGNAASRSSHGPVTIGLVACLLLAGCGTSADGRGSESAGAEADRMPAAKLTNGVSGENPPGVAYGEADGDVKLAEVTLSPTHTVVFWQDASGVVTVLESFNADLNPDGSRLDGFNARRDSFADLYQTLSGDARDAATHERLRAIDATREKAGKLVRAKEPSDVPESLEIEADLDLVPKTVQEDLTWFTNTYCVPRRRKYREDSQLCFGDPLTPNPGGWTATLNVQDYEEVNIAFFNAHTSTIGHLITQGRTCGFLELGVCTGLRVRSMDVPPRWVSIHSNTADDGFYTTATGNAFALHYMFWL